MGNDLVDGHKAMGATFVNVGEIAEDGSRGILISQLAASGSEKFGGTGNPTISIETLKPNGSPDLTFTYHKGDKTRGYTNDGWYRGTKQITEAAANDYTIKAGESLWVSGTSELTITFVTPFEDAE